MQTAAKEQGNSVVTFGPYRLHRGEGRLWRGKQVVKLTPKAFATLSHFVAHPGQLVTKEDLFAAVWRQTVVSEATLTSYIKELRQALRDVAKEPRYIETVPRRGYRFIAPVAAAAAPRPKEGREETGASTFPVSVPQSQAAHTQDAALGTVTPPALPLPDKPSIIVLPFVNMSHDP